MSVNQKTRLLILFIPSGSCATLGDAESLQADANLYFSGSCYCCCYETQSPFFVC